jgi:zinc protease
MMRAAIPIALAGALLGGALEAAGAPTPRHPDELTLPPMQFNPIPAERVELACGVPAVLYENHDLPILNLTLQFRMGTRYLPAEEHTACALFGALWRDGGTRSLPPDSLDAILTALDANVTAWIGDRSGQVDVSLSSEDVERALPLWAEVALRPGFDADRLERARANRLRELQEINNDPGAIADRHLGWLLYGRDFPGVHLATRAEIEGVTVDQLRALHARFVRPENAIVGVSGDFDRRTMVKLLDRLFRDWPRVGPYLAPAPEPWTPAPQPGVYLLRGDYAQSQVRVGRLVPDLTDDSPDRAAASILSFALGYERVFYRTREEGLSYGTYLMLGVDPERATLTGGGSGRGDATLPLLRAMFEECDRLATDPIAGPDLEAARVFMIGREVQGSATAASIVYRKVRDLLRGRPDDYREQYLQSLKSASAEDIDRLARRHVTVDDPWVVLVLGDPSTFGAPLDSLGLGPVREVEPVVFGE